jgi:hypothetical protein
MALTLALPFAAAAARERTIHLGGPVRQPGNSRQVVLTDANLTSQLTFFQVNARLA